MADSEMRDESLHSAQSSANDQPLMTSFLPFNHGVLSIRPAPPASLQPPSSVPNPQGNALPLVHMPLHQSDLQPSLFTFNTDLERMVAASTFDRLGPGAKTVADIEYFQKFNRYPARSLDGVHLSILFSINPKECVAETDWMNLMYIEAAKCDTMHALFKMTKAHWRKVFNYGGFPFPKYGILTKNVTIYFKNTHGDARLVWIDSHNAERYEGWFRDHIVHGRVDTAFVHLIHNEPAEE